MNKEQMKIELIELNYLITQFIKKSPEFDRNIFEYFVCFSETSPNKVALNCRR